MKKAIGAQKTKCYMTVRFWGIQSRTAYGIRYSSKIISVVNPIIEKNGRIHAADILEVMLTESDYARYKELYTWDDMEIIEPVDKGQSTTEEDKHDEIKVRLKNVKSKSKIYRA